MRLLFLTPYYPPEVGAPQARIHELAVRLVRRGHEVQVLTALPNYPSGVVPPEYRDKAGTWEERDGVQVHRVWIYATPNKGFVRRVVAHLSFMAAAILAAPRMAECDAVYVESPPLFDGVAGWVLARAKGARMIFNIADLWPQSVVELGMISPGFLLSAATALERWCYRQADLILAVTSGIEQIMRERGYASKVAWFPNGVDSARFAAGDGASLRRDLGLAGKFVLLYAGTFGLAQGLSSVLAAARLLADDPRIHLVLAGDGADRERLVGEAGPNVTILPSQPAARMPDLLAAADVCLVALRDLPLFLGAVPSKTYEAMAAARPVLLAAKGEVAALLERAAAGVVVPPEDPAALAAAARTLAADPETCRRLGESGRRFVSEHFDRDVLAARFEALLRGVTGPEASPGGII
ncbi:MAG: glycosyltransferase family 4 protein [Candidatus Sericytochromatia bacterium]|nr:glycosyltransferase family 4 protein [Candidatus Tanganyikabacteria bacterium]